MEDPWDTRKLDIANAPAYEVEMYVFYQSCKYFLRYNI